MSVTLARVSRRRRRRALREAPAAPAPRHAWITGLVTVMIVLASTSCWALVAVVAADALRSAVTP